MPLKLSATGKTDVGLVRQGNEDFLHIDKSNNVFAVCDGMGGHQGGEIASMTAAETIGFIFNNFQDEIGQDSALKVENNIPTNGDLLLRSVRLANRAIHYRADREIELSGMGTTVVALAFEKDVVSVVHVGDSRAYRIDEKQLTPLTMDHSWVAEIQAKQDISAEEAETMVGKNVITRALGVRNTVEVDVRTLKVKEGQKFLLCSDGLCGYSDDIEIFRVVKQFRDDNDQIVENLIRMANERGGADNVTILVVEVKSIEESDYAEIEAFTVPAENNATLEAEDKWLQQMATARETAGSKESNGESDEPNGKKALMVIFALFIVIVAVVIWQVAGK